eukprot:scaffold96091_cov19-Tisochrysis_lutea.AAC.3
MALRAGGWGSTSTKRLPTPTKQRKRWPERFLMRAVALRAGGWEITSTKGLATLTKQRRKWPEWVQARPAQSQACP